ncbi:MAG: helix-turn-helix domain-containing protein [Bacillus subtilis]|nr:helix-turn-helix domain-containing protein [Bacillus subtilis]
MNKIHENIKRLRLQQGLTQEAVANQLFVSRQLVSKWEQGKSLPDILAVEKLAIVLGATIHDLIDDESVKSIALNEATSIGKRNRMTWTSIVISLIALFIGSVAWYFLTQILVNRTENLSTESAEIASIDEYRMIFENLENDFRLEMDLSGDTPEVFNSRNTRVDFDVLQLGDIVELTYSDITKKVTKIQIIDSLLVESLYGVIVTAHPNDYQSMYDAIQKDQGVRYVFDKWGSSGANTQSDLVSVIEEYYFALSYTLTVYIDPLKVTDDLFIGLLTSNGVRYVDAVDLSSQGEYIYSGRYEIEDAPFGSVHSVYVTYRVVIRFQYSVDSFILYEYDKSHNLVQETLLDDWQMFHQYAANDNSLYGFLKTTTIKRGGLMSTYEEVKVLEIFRGAKEVLYITDDYGFVQEYRFSFD